MEKIISGKIKGEEKTKGIKNRGREDKLTVLKEGWKKRGGRQEGKMSEKAKGEEEREENYERW